MKKVLTIGLMLLVCAGFVFAADPAKLNVQIVVGENNNQKWLAKGTDVSTVSKFDEATAISGTQDLATTKEFLAAVRSNSENAMTITVEGEALHTDDSKIIPLTASFTDTDSKVNESGEALTITWEAVGDDEMDTITFTEKTDSEKTSSRVIALSMVLSYDDSTAFADTYNAQLTLTVSTNA